MRRDRVGTRAAAYAVLVAASVFYLLPLYVLAVTSDSAATSSTA